VDIWHSAVEILRLRHNATSVQVFKLGLVSLISDV